MARWDRFDICEAYYLYYSSYHSGMFSDEYMKLSKLLSYFTPSPLLTLESACENVKEIYGNLVARLQGKKAYTLEEYIEAYHDEVWIDPDHVEVPESGLELYAVYCGLPGCLPNYSSLSLTLEDAIDDAESYINPNGDLDSDYIKKELRDCPSWDTDDNCTLTIERLTQLPG